MMQKRRQTSLILIHHSDSDRMKTTREDIERWHLAKGWEAIGYNKVILGSGEVKQGRPDEMVGAHCPGANSKSIGICLTGKFVNGGDVLKRDDPQYKALIQTLATLCRRWRIPVQAIQGHRDYYATACPGTVYDLLPQIREEVKKYL